MTTTYISDSLQTLDEACQVLVYDFDHPNRHIIALGVLHTGETIMREYSIDLFTEQEAVFIMDAMACAVQLLHDYSIENGNEESYE